MTDPRFLQDELDKKLFHAMEEASEFITAASKMMRWGAYSVNPLLPENEQTHNIDWVVSEAEDLQITLLRFLSMLSDMTQEEIEEAFPLA